MRNGKRTSFTLRDVIHAPGSPHNLISLGRIEAAGFKLEILDGILRFLTRAGTFILTGRRVSKFLYDMDVHPSNDMTPHVHLVAPSRPVRTRTWNEWH
ncbi:hypothetical protein B0H21DRAFT_704929, partial [Amylocystis lapponica]